MLIPLQDQVPPVNEEASEPGLPNGPVNSHGVRRRAEMNTWTPRGWILVYVVVSIHYGDHNVAKISVSPSTSHTLNVDERLHQFLLLVIRERHVMAIL